MTTSNRGFFLRSPQVPDWPPYLKANVVVNEKTRTTKPLVVGMMKQHTQGLYVFEFDGAKSGIAWKTFRYITGPAFQTPGVIEEVFRQLLEVRELVWGQLELLPKIAIVDDAWLKHEGRRDVKPAIRIQLVKGLCSGLAQIMDRGFDLSRFGLEDATVGKRPLVPIQPDDGEEEPELVDETVQAAPVQSIQPARSAAIEQVGFQPVQPVVQPVQPVVQPVQPVVQPVQPVVQPAEVPALTIPDDAGNALASMVISAMTGAQFQSAGLFKRGDMQSPLPVKLSRKSEQSMSSMSSSSPVKRTAKARALSTPKPITSTSAKTKNSVDKKKGRKNRMKDREPEPDSEEEPEEEPDEVEPEEDDHDESEEQGDEQDSSSGSGEESETDEEEAEHIRSESARRRHDSRARRRDEPPVELNTEIRSENEDVTTLARRARYQRGLQSEIVRSVVQQERHLDDMARAQALFSERIEEMQEQLDAVNLKLSRVLEEHHQKMTHSSSAERNTRMQHQGQQQHREKTSGEGRVQGRR